MAEDLERLKQRIPLLQYLQRHNWRPCRAGTRQEFVGLCPLHQETSPSFYVNAAKNLFYCHGCGRGGDLIRFVQLFLDLPFRQTVAHLKQELTPAPASQLLEQTAAFYQFQLHRHPEATRYLEHRGLHNPALIEELGIGYAPGGNLRRHLAGSGLFVRSAAGGRLDQQPRARRLLPTGHLPVPTRRPDRQSLRPQYRRRVSPPVAAALQRWLVCLGVRQQFLHVILVEGLFDLAVLWQAGFRNTTCAIGTQLTPAQWAQLADQPGRSVHLVFDQDDNQAGQRASHQLALRLQDAGIRAYIVQLPHGHDPNSYFVAGASAADFTDYLEQAQQL